MQDDPFPQAEQAAPGTGYVRRAARWLRTGRRPGRPARRSVVGYLHCQPAGPVVQRDHRPRHTCVLEHIGERLLNHPVGGQVRAGRQAPWRAKDAQLNIEPGGRHPVGQRRELAKPRQRPQPPAGLAVSQGAGLLLARHGKQAQHVLQFGHGRPAARLDGEQGRPGLVLFGAEHLPGGAGLHDHHADVVGHHIVQLAGDPRPLQLQRTPGRGLMLGLCPQQPRAGVPGPGTPDPDRVAEARDRQQDREGGQPAQRRRRVLERRRDDQPGQGQAGQRQAAVPAVDDRAVAGDE